MIKSPSDCFRLGASVASCSPWGRMRTAGTGAKRGWTLSHRVWAVEDAKRVGLCATGCRLPSGVGLWIAGGRVPSRVGLWIARGRVPSGVGLWAGSSCRGLPSGVGLGSCLVCRWMRRRSRVHTRGCGGRGAWGRCGVGRLCVRTES